MENTSRRCINCSLRLRYLRWQSLREVNDETYATLASWIAPTPISREDVVCMECLASLQNALQAGPAGTALFGHTSVCYVCGISILRARTSRVPSDSEERNIILRLISPHLAPILERVCRACWMSARRHVQRQLQQDENRSAAETEGAAAPEPPPLPPQGLFQQPRRQEPTLTSRTYKRVPSTTRHCLFPECANGERYLVPRIMKESILSHHRIYIPPCARVCNLHLNWEYWDQMQASHADFTGSQMDNLLAMLENISLRKIDFSNIHLIPPHLCHYWLGLNATQFYNLLNSKPQLYEEVPNASVALSIYLVKLRTGDSNERLSGLFDMPRSTLERYMNKAKNIFEENCPENE